MGSLRQEIRKLWRRLSGGWRDEHTGAGVAEELEFHRARRQEAFEQEGLSPIEARAASQRVMGNMTLAREEARATWSWTTLELFWGDLRYAVRSLRREKTFSVVAILTLATGICATTTIFSVVDSQIWRPLPFPDSERLVSISLTESGDASAREPARSQDYLAWRTETAVFQGIAAFRWSERRTLRGRGLPDSVLVRPVTEGFFRVLGKAVALGRSFEPRDAAEGGVILSDAGWRRLFNADPSIVGSAVTLDDRAHVIVGVAAAGQLEFTSDPDLFTVFDVRPAAPQNPSLPLNVFGRLADGIPIATAQAAARTTVERATGGDVSPHRRSVRVQTLREAYTGWNWRPLFFFLGAAVFVLMLGCANVANLLLARALRRQREFAIRGAIGGGRGALIRLLIVEGAVLAVVGGAAGLLAASWTLRGLPSWIPPDYVDRGGPLALDARVYLLALLLTSLTGILFGLAPMFFAVRRNLQGMLVQGGRSIGGSRLQQRVRHGFVVIEIMMALVLVVGAGLFLNSFIRLTNQPLGFEPRGRLTMSFSLTGQRYEDPQGIARFASRLVERARAVAGVADAAIGTTAPLDGGSGVRFIDAQRPRPGAGKEPRAIVRAVTPGFHRVLGIVRLSGRDFTERDDITATRVAIVNERLAVRVFGNGNPIGQSLVLLQSDADWVRPGTVEIVGVVANFKEVGLNEADFSDIAVPLAQHLSGSLELIAHTTIDVRPTVDTLRHEVGVLDPSVPVRTVSTMEEAVAEASRGERFNLLLIGGFALAAVFMAGVGIFGAMAYSMEQRTQEFGIRVALGAGRSGILRLAISQAVRIGAAGTALGLGLALVVARMIGSALYLVPTVHDGLIYGVTTTDPMTLTLACVSVMTLAAAAGLFPAARATRVDPLLALRCD